MSNIDPRPTTASFDYQPETWMADAACSDKAHDPTWWDCETVGPRQDATEKATAICGDCPVRLRCLDYVMRAETTQWARYGIWAGLTPEQRRELSRVAS